MFQKCIRRIKLPKLRKLKLHLTNEKDIELELIKIGELYISNEEIKILYEDKSQLKEILIKRDNLDYPKWDYNIRTLKYYFEIAEKTIQLF